MFDNLIFLIDIIRHAERIDSSFLQCLPDGFELFDYNINDILVKAGHATLTWPDFFKDLIKMS